MVLLKNRRFIEPRGALIPERKLRPKHSRIKLPLKAYRILCNFVMDRDAFRCVVPGCRRRSGVACHHIVFRSDGGDDVSANLLTMCQTCHDALHIHGWLVIAPLVEGESIDANVGVQFVFSGAWRPRRIK